MASGIIDFGVIIVTIMIVTFIIGSPVWPLDRRLSGATPNVHWYLSHICLLREHEQAAADRSLPLYININSVSLLQDGQSDQH